MSKNYSDLFRELNQESIKTIPYDEIQYYISAGKSFIKDAEDALKPNSHYSLNATEKYLEFLKDQLKKRKSILNDLEHRYATHPDKNKSKDKEIQRIKSKYSFEDISDNEINLLGYDDLVYVINKFEPEVNRVYQKYSSESERASRAGVYGHPFLSKLEQHCDKLSSVLKRLENAKDRTPEGKSEIQVAKWISSGKCRFCGGDFKGFFARKCTSCGKEKRQ